MDLKAHWEHVYASKAEDEVSWFEESPALSLALIQECGAGPDGPVIDIGAGSSRLADALLAKGFKDVTALDLSENALARAKARLGDRASSFAWIVADATRWQPPRKYALWHDRAVFHFLTAAEDRARYRERLLAALQPGGHAIIGTFAPDGPERCSGLPVARYDAAALAAELGPAFGLKATRNYSHLTPAGKVQKFQFCSFRRLP